MASRIAVRKIERMAREVENKSRVDRNIARFMEAHSRGMVLCKEGVERSFWEWAKMRGIDKMLRKIKQDESENFSELV